MERLLSQLELARAEGSDLSDAELIRRIAHDELRDLGVAEPPVDIAMVASARGVRRIVRDQLLTTAGCLLSESTGLTVRVRASDSPTRQRFTIAHEVGHTFLPGYAMTTQYRCTPRVAPRRDETEALCDLAASELLMPEALWVADLGTFEFGLEGLEALAQRYNVSLVAAGFRYVAHFSAPAAVLVFEPAQKPSEYGTVTPPKLRLQYSRTHGHWPYLIRHKSADENSCFHRAWEGEIVHEHTTIHGISREPLAVDAAAKLYPYFDGDTWRERVIALICQTVH